MRKTLLLLALALASAACGAGVARGAETVAAAPSEEVSFPFFCDWGYDWDERCYRDTWSPRVSIGGDRYSVRRAGLRFPLTEVPAGSAVLRARLLLSYDRVCVGLDARDVPCDGRRWDLEIVPILGAWFEEREPYLGWPVAWLTIPAGAPAGRLELDVTDLVAEWVDGASENDGLLVKLADSQEAVRGSGPKPPGRLFPTATMRPRLEVDFVRPG